MRSARKVGHFVAFRDAQLSTCLSLRRYIDELVLQLSSPWRRSIASTLSQLVQTRKIIDELPFSVIARFVELIQTHGPQMSFMRFLRSNEHRRFSSPYVVENFQPLSPVPGGRGFFSSDGVRRCHVDRGL